MRPGARKALELSTGLETKAARELCEELSLLKNNETQE